MGIRKAVNITIINAKPSIPRIQFILKILNQELRSTNWKWDTVGSKKKKITQQTFKIINDQKRPKFLIKAFLVLSTRDKKKQPIKGSVIIQNSIEKCCYKCCKITIHFIKNLYKNIALNGFEPFIACWWNKWT